MDTASEEALWNYAAELVRKYYSPQIINDVIKTIGQERLQYYLKRV